MFKFTLKKTFFDVWDNLFKIFILNFILLLLVAALVYIPGLFYFNFFIYFTIIFLIALTIIIFLGNCFLFTLEMSEYKNPDFSEFFVGIKKSFFPSIGIAVILTLFILVSRFSTGYYLSFANTGIAIYESKEKLENADIEICYFDKKNGFSKYSLFINDKNVKNWQSDKAKKSDIFLVEKITGLTLKEGDKLIIMGRFINGELPVLDYIKIYDNLTGKVFLIQAEELILDNYNVIDIPQAENGKAIALSFTKKGFIGLVIAIFLTSISLAVIISFQYFFPLYYRLNEGFFNSIRLSFKLFFDNIGFSIAAFFTSIGIMLFSMFFAYVFPGVCGIFVWLHNCVKLRLYKYDYLEKNKTSKKIPWDVLLSHDVEIVGPRSFRDIIFPWKY